MSSNLQPPSKRLGDRLHGELVALISRRGLQPGAKLPSETELAQQFKVSRPSVREALSRLRDEGLIVSRRGSGSYVQTATPPSPELAPADPESVRIDSFEQILKCYEFRKVLEGEACALAARHRTPAQLQELAELLNSLGHLSHGRSDLDMQFHLAIARASGSGWYHAALVSISGQIELAIEIARKLSLGHSTDHLRTIQAEHEAIYKAIEAGNVEHAREAMRSHLSNTAVRIFRGPGSQAADVGLDGPAGSAPPGMADSP